MTSPMELVVITSEIVGMTRRHAEKIGLEFSPSRNQTCRRENHYSQGEIAVRMLGQLRMKLRAAGCISTAKMVARPSATSAVVECGGERATITWAYGPRENYSHGYTALLRQSDWRPVNSATAGRS